jgi:hypothetical protein
MRKILLRQRSSNDHDQSLSLFDFAERQRWASASSAARMVRRRCGIASPATAHTIAELAGFRVERDR